MNEIIDWKQVASDLTAALNGRNARIAELEALLREALRGGSMCGHDRVMLKFEEQPRVENYFCNDCFRTVYRSEGGPLRERIRQTLPPKEQP